MNTLTKTLGMVAAAGLLTVSQAQADQVILDDLIVDGSACIGFDCVNGESFGFDTIRIKENNLRIRAQDTSSTASFPSNDWQITFNDSANGGANKFSIDDIDGGRTPFTIEAGAPSHSLYVDDGGRLGLGTSTPVVDVHIKSGNTPTLRLEQDGSSGFTPQIWDVAGNEANFFVRDATNGSTLPFRIFPAAPSNALTIEASTGDVGIGTTSPDNTLDIEDGNPSIRFTDSDKTGANTTSHWAITTGGVNNGDDLLLATTNPGAIVAATFDRSGNLTIAGGLTTAMNTLPDYVFEPDYKLMSLDELAAYIKTEKHLPNVISAQEVESTGSVNLSEMTKTLLLKVEELTLYTLQQQERIAALEASAAD